MESWLLKSRYMTNTLELSNCLSYFTTLTYQTLILYIRLQHKTTRLRIKYVIIQTFQNT